MKHLPLSALLLCLPLSLSAHTRWFAEKELLPLQTTEPTMLYMGVWAFIILIVLLLGIIFHQRNIFRLGFLRPKAPHAYERAASTFAMVTGSFLVIAGTHEYLFSPNLTHEAGIPFAMISIQIAIGIAFMLGIATRTFSFVLMGLYLATFYFGGWLASLEDIWILSTAAFIAVMGNDYFSIISYSYFKEKLYPFKEYALSFLRLGTGATLVILGFSEKLLAPEYGINFLSLHNWNFMQSLGFPFSDYLFVLSAGSVEVFFGLIFIFGVVTRLNALVVAIVFTIPLFLLGPIELAGHIPHFAAIILLLLFGNGGHFLIFKKYPDAQVGKEE
ncbi:MAG: putative membrane protein YphA (DoxX/SURF4 family) [Patiriisocius sp.]|jgi:uncharacterized membrane protein YphA (DoxX/SURF4 family)